MGLLRCTGPVLASVGCKTWVVFQNDVETSEGYLGFIVIKVSVDGLDTNRKVLQMVEL